MWWKILLGVIVALPVLALAAVFGIALFLKYTGFDPG